MLVASFALLSPLFWLSNCFPVTWNLSAPVSLVPHLWWEVHLFLTRSVPFWMLRRHGHSSAVLYFDLSTKPLTSPFVKRSWACQRASPWIVAWISYVTLASRTKTLRSCQQCCVTRALLFNRLVSSHRCVVHVGWWWTHLVHTARKQARLSSWPFYFQHAVRHGSLSSPSETRVAQHVFSGKTSWQPSVLGYSFCKVSSVCWQTGNLVWIAHFWSHFWCWSSFPDDPEFFCLHCFCLFEKLFSFCLNILYLFCI